jgi:hypothetical protein
MTAIADDAPLLLKRLPVLYSASRWGEVSRRMTYGNR